jgi:Tol biopolymer transport system component
LLRFLAVAGAAILALALVQGGSSSRPPALVAPGSFLVANLSGRLLVLDRNGKLVRRLPAWASRGTGLQGIELAPDRRHAFVAVLRSERPAQLYRVDLATGYKRLIANAIAPTLSPDGKRLAYVTTRLDNGIVLRGAVVVVGLDGGGRRAIPFGSRVPMGTPPEILINWSPDGRRVAVFDGSRIRLVEVATARDVPSQAALPDAASGLAPVYADAQTIVVLADCCIGRQHLAAVDLRSGGSTPFATISSPPEAVRRLKPGLLVAVTALHELAVVRRGSVHTIARGVVAVAAG